MWAPSLSIVVYQAVDAEHHIRSPVIWNPSEQVGHRLPEPGALISPMQLLLKLYPTVS